MTDKEIDPIDGTFDDVSNAIVGKAKEILGRYALLSGELPVGGKDLQCAVLDDETRVLSATSVFKAFDRPRRANSRMEIDGITIPAFLDASNLKEYINQDVMKRITPIEYRDGSSTKSGYDAKLLIDICDIYLKARREGVLNSKQMHLAEKAEIIQTAFAYVGIEAVIDEATGYQHARSSDALRVLLSRYIAEGLQKWMKTFPDSFFDQLDKLYDNEKTASNKRPQYYGKFINKYVYNPIENGYIKAELDKLNITDDGKRKARFHQWLNSDGRDTLIRQIGRVEARMEMFDEIDKFKLAEAKQKAITVAPYMFDEMNKLIE